jgi:hypothetical protein
MEEYHENVEGENIDSSASGDAVYLSLRKM